MGVISCSSTAESGLNAGLNANGAGASEEDRAGVRTKFVAETLLPTNQGKFRLRGYRHTVSLAESVAGSPPPHRHA